MSISELDLQQFSPCRTPDWRAERVLRLLRWRGRPRTPSRVNDDEAIHIYWKFLRDWQRLTGDARLALFRKHDPGLYYSQLLVEHPNREHRAILESHLLMRRPLEEAAHELSTVPEALEWYEKLHFNVRDRLENEDWIYTIIGERLRGYDALDMSNALQPEGRRALYLLAAYYGGPVAFRVIRAGIKRTLNIPREPAQFDRWISDAQETVIKTKGWNVAQTLPIDRWNGVEFLALANRLLEQEKQAGAASGTAGTVEKHVGDFLADSNMQPVMYEADAPPRRITDKFARGVVECRADDLNEAEYLGKPTQRLLAKDDDFHWRDLKEIK